MNLSPFAHMTSPRPVNRDERLVSSLFAESHSPVNETVSESDESLVSESENDSSTRLRDFLLDFRELFFDSFL